MAIVGTLLPVDIRNPIQAFVVSQPLVNGLAIRDTIAHDITTDVAISYLDCRHLPGNKLLFYNNSLNQTATVQLFVSPDGVNFYLVGATQSMTNATSGFIDTTAYAQLANAYPYVALQVKCSVAPVSGNLTVSLIAKSL